MLHRVKLFPSGYFANPLPTAGSPAADAVGILENSTNIFEDEDPAQSFVNVRAATW